MQCLKEINRLRSTLKKELSQYDIPLEKSGKKRQLTGTNDICTIKTKKPKLVNPLPTKVAQLLDPLCFVCTLEQNRPTHSDVPRQGDKTCFFAKKWSVFAPPP